MPESEAFIVQGRRVEKEEEESILVISMDYSGWENRKRSSSGSDDTPDIRTETAVGWSLHHWALTGGTLLTEHYGAYAFALHLLLRCGSWITTAAVITPKCCVSKMSS
ncbi:hypothetical protein E2C01_048719 [Portunus trituberculatus]|uniref:Uncharacterized protein n=1 Tax=Portunus trituberculatus TaxID=210409 RepID=A0A5B7GBV9_PORTR|nr:hypothetical protein [Portunus trituberculatus]